MSLLKISLHLTDDGSCEGGGFALYDLDGTLLASEAMPRFNWRIEPSVAAVQITEAFLARHGHQLAF